MLIRKLWFEHSPHARLGTIWNNGGWRIAHSRQRRNAPQERHQVPEPHAVVAKDTFSIQRRERNVVALEFPASCASPFRLSWQRAGNALSLVFASELSSKNANLSPPATGYVETPYQQVWQVSRLTLTSTSLLREFEAHTDCRLALEPPGGGRQEQFLFSSPFQWANNHFQVSVRYLLKRESVIVRK